MKRSIFRRSFLVAVVSSFSLNGHAQVLMQSPNWEIVVSNYGYSDYLGDLTPGFEGREYLSGEWAGAISYQGTAPTWLEPNFIFPDWTTNSNFTVLQPMTLGSPNSYGLPTAASVISNGALRITQNLEIVDTVTGMAMGNAAASSPSGNSLQSNRYVLMHSYTFENTSNATMQDFQFFQFLHGLTAESGVYDNRDYGGAMGNYRYDITQGGNSDAGAGQFDYIGFHSSAAPTAFEVGRYGVVGTDDHGLGKPSVGTHLSVESNSLTNVDHFAPSELWVGGAQRFDLGTLNPNQSKTFAVALSILTGYQVAPEAMAGSIGGGSLAAGGVDYVFDGAHGTGTFFINYSLENANGIASFVNAGEFGDLSFSSIGGFVPLWNIEYNGNFNDSIRLTFGIDPVLLSSGIDPNRWSIYHWTGGSWENLGGNFNASNNTFTVLTDHLSPFALGVAPVPEPETYALLLAGLGLVGWMVRRNKERANIHIVG